MIENQLFSFDLVCELFENELKMFIREKKINISFKTAKSKIVYAINNASKDKVKKNFYYVFKTEYDTYYLTIKNIVDAIIGLITRNFYDCN